MRRAYELARADLGTWEWKDGHNPKVVQYFKDVGHGWVVDDETAWCAAFVGSRLKAADLPHTGSLAARSYLNWGDPVEIGDAREGDIVVFWRGSPKGWQGHVGFFVEDTGDHIRVLGGNQGNSVSIRPYAKSRLLGVRRHAGNTFTADQTIRIGGGVSMRGATGGDQGAGTVNATAVYETTPARMGFWRRLWRFLFAS